MTILDLRLLAEQKVVTINDKSDVTIASRHGSPLPLTAKESLQLQFFLRTNSQRIEAFSGGTPLRERIRVWQPAVAKEAMPKTYHATVWLALEQNPGRASMCGNLSKGLASGYHYGGFSPDAKSFVLIPVALYTMRWRFLLLEACRATLPPESSEDLFLLAGAMCAEESLSDTDDSSPGLIQTAREQALDVVYWLQIAGPTPIAQDTRDARR